MASRRGSSSAFIEEMGVAGDCALQKRHRKNSVQRGIIRCSWNMITTQHPATVSYKRNQIEEAIGRIFDPNCDKPPSELRTRIKRLLELDRSMGRKVRSKDPEEGNFAFFSEEAPGTGVDISFSEYEAFALINGLRIMNHRAGQNAVDRPV